MIEILCHLAETCCLHAQSKKRNTDHYISRFVAFAWLKYVGAENVRMSERQTNLFTERLSKQLDCAGRMERPTNSGRIILFTGSWRTCFSSILILSSSPIGSTAIQNTSWIS